jgi:osmoprotectant transport system substrate-binding protein
MALLACGSTTRPALRDSALGDDAITVGSFDFAESSLLAEIYSQALERHGYTVRRSFDLGPREFVAPALSRGLIELVPEYAGTALDFRSLGTAAGTADVQSTHDRLVRALRGTRVTALAPAPAQDANTFVVTRATAAREGLRTLSDLAKVAPHLSFGGPPECPSRRECLAGIRRVYGAEFEEFVELDAGGPITRQAVAQGYVDVALLFTTDPSITRRGLVELVDDRGLQPAENVVPLIRTELRARFGLKLVRVLDGVSADLTTDALGQLNGEVAAGATTARVAARWLRTAQQS